MNGNIDANTGAVSANGRVLAYPGITRLEFERIHEGNLSPCPAGPDFVTYGPLDVTMDKKRFVVGIRFFKETLHGVTFTWKDGRVATLGYDASENDLLAEKKVLTAMLARQFGIALTNSSLGADVFEFSWGGVVSRADLKSTWAGIDVRYL